MLWSAGCNAHTAVVGVVDDMLDYSLIRSENGDCIEPESFLVFRGVLTSSPTVTLTDDGSLVLANDELELVGEPTG